MTKSNYFHSQTRPINLPEETPDSEISQQSIVSHDDLSTLRNYKLRIAEIVIKSEFKRKIPPIKIVINVRAKLECKFIQTEVAIGMSNRLL